MPHAPSTASGLTTPDVLVLGGGGILGEAWMSGVLAGIAENGAFDARECAGFVGTSAGSIVAAMLCAGIDPASRLGRLPEQPAVEVTGGSGLSLVRRALRAGGSLGGVAAGPLAAATLGTVAPGGRLLRKAALARVPRGRRSLSGLGRSIEGAGARWDGRLRIAAVDLHDGRRVIFGSPGEPEISVGGAVEASCAIPGVFRPVTANGRSYVDGGVWSPTNLDVAVAKRGAHVLCLNPTGGLRTRGGGPLAALGPVSRSAAAIEAASLRRHGARVTVISPDGPAAEAMGPSLMDSAPRAAVIAASVAQGRRFGRG